MRFARSVGRRRQRTLYNDAVKRRLFKLVLFLLLGAVVNVAVAWGCALWHYVGEATRTPGVMLLEDGSTSWVVASYRSRMAHRMHSVWGPSALLSGQPSEATPSDLARGWTDILAPDAADGGKPTGSRVFDGRGWPMISMWSALELEFMVQQTPGLGPRASPGKVTRVTSGIELAPYSQFRSAAPQHQYRVLPLGIIWSGFALNMLVFAATGFCLVAVLRYSRLAWRIGAGHCPGCAYDLRNATHDQCPECGSLVRLARLGSPSAQRLRLAVAVAWSCLLLAALVGGGALLWPRITAHNWDAYKPTWWLVTKARSLDEAKSGSALNELIERIKDDKLPKETIASMVREALAIQADVEQPWVPQWGDVVTTARSMKLVSDEDWLAFARQALVPELVVRSRIIEGDPVAATLFLHKRAPTDQVLVVQVQHQKTSLGDQATQAQTTTRTMWPMTTMGPMTTQLNQQLPMPGRSRPPTFIDIGTGRDERFLWARPSTEQLIADVAPGKHVFDSSWTIVISEGSFGGGTTGYTTTADLFSQTIRLQANVEVLPRGTQTVERVSDESLRPAMEAALSLRYCRARRRGSAPTMISGLFDFDAPPMDFAFDVFVRSGEREWPVGQIDSEREHPWDFSGAFGGRADGVSGDQVDVILRPSQAAARQTLRITRIWNGEIVFENVPLRRDN